jgi:hypothetical protein
MCHENPKAHDAWTCDDAPGDSVSRMFVAEREIRMKSAQWACQSTVAGNVSAHQVRQCKMVRAGIASMPDSVVWIAVDTQRRADSNTAASDRTEAALEKSHRHCRRALAALAATETETRCTVVF